MNEENKKKSLIASERKPASDYVRYLIDLFFVAKKQQFLVICVRFLDIAVFLCVGVHSRGSLNQLCAGSTAHGCDIKLTHQITFLLCAASLAFKDRLVICFLFFFCPRFVSRADSIHDLYVVLEGSAVTNFQM